MYDDFARHRQTSQRRTQVLMLGFALMAIATIIRLSYLQLVSAQEYRNDLRDWVDLPPVYVQPLRGDILDRNGVVLAQDAPSWQVEVDYEALNGPLLKDGSGRSDYVRRLARRQLQEGKYPRGTMIPPAALQAAEESVHQAIAASWQKLSDLTGVPSWKILANIQQVVDRVRAIRDGRAAMLGLADDPFRTPLVEPERQYHPIVMDIPANVATIIRQELPETQYKWLRVSISGSRTYPHADDRSLTPLIGMMRQVSKEDLGKDPNEGNDLMELRAGEKLGASGAESAAEELLRGQRGKLIRKRGSEPMVEAEPVRGNDVHLTIDTDLQRWIYQRLSQAVHANATASGAAAVVLDVDTREVLAAVSYPGYKLDEFNKEYDRLRKDTKCMPTLPRAFSGQYQPGSIAKPITVLAALSSGVITPTDTVNCTGYFIPGQKGWRCWTVSHGTPPHGPVSAITALEHSCNIYCVTVGQRTGIPRLTDWMYRFGLGATTGSGLHEEENGLVPSLDYFNKHNRTPAVADIRNFSIGEGEVQVTPLQAANVGATIAAGIWKPVTLIRELPPATRAHALPTSAEYLHDIRQGMYEVVNNPEGTAYNSGRSKAIKIAGKTGTAEGSPRALAYGYDVKMHDGQIRTMEFISKEEAKDELTRLGESVVEYKRTYTRWWPAPPSRDSMPTHAWFMGYAPADSAPKIAVAVIIEYGGGGAKVAGPVAKDIFERYFDVETEHKGADEPETQG